MEKRALKAITTHGETYSVPANIKKNTTRKKF